MVVVMVGGGDYDDDADDNDDVGGLPCEYLSILSVFVCTSLFSSHAFILM